MAILALIATITLIAFIRALFITVDPIATFQKPFSPLRKEMESINFSLLVKAQSHLSPPAKKKIPKMSLNHALETIQTPWFWKNKASLEDLFLKTIFLVASGNRCSELAACTRQGKVSPSRATKHHSHQRRLSCQVSNQEQDASSCCLPFHSHKTSALASIRLVFIIRKILASFT